MNIRSGSQPSTAQGHFSQIPKAEIQRSVFNRTHGLKTTINTGDLVPILVDEALPGDTITVNLTTFARMATPALPLMDNQFVDYFFFAVPNRLIWDNWQKFNGEQDNPDDSTDFEVPTMTSPTSNPTGELSAGYDVMSLHDYLGLPIGIPDMEHSALFTRAVSLIWNEWFRDENLQDSIVVDKDDGPDDPADYVLMKRGKRKDYFTSCLPFPQKGPAVTIPILDTAAVTGGALVHAADRPTFIGDNGTAQQLDALNGSDAVEFTGLTSGDSALQWGDSGITFDDTGMTADLGAATQATINQLRQAFQVQRLYERDARGGTRYTEILKSHFGVSSPDQRLQRPEFLGGGSTVVTIHPVARTAGTTGVGELGAFATSGGRAAGFSKSFTEHCVIIGFAATRADLNYQQGLNRMWSRKSRWDFYWPALSHLGEQAILNKEIYAQGSVDADADEAVFGYQERNAEYRYKPSQITGQMRSIAPTTIDAYHLAQDFSTLPVLDGPFIEEDPPIERILQVAENFDYILDCYFEMKHARPMPTYGVPGMIDHF